MATPVSSVLVTARPLVRAVQANSCGERAEVDAAPLGSHGNDAGLLDAHADYSIPRRGEEALQTDASSRRILGDQETPMESALTDRANPGSSRAVVAGAEIRETEPVRRGADSGRAAAPPAPAQHSVSRTTDHLTASIVRADQSSSPMDASSCSHALTLKQASLPDDESSTSTASTDFPGPFMVSAHVADEWKASAKSLARLLAISEEQRKSQAQRLAEAEAESQDARQRAAEANADAQAQAAAKEAALVRLAHERIAQGKEEAAAAHVHAQAWRRSAKALAARLDSQTCAQVLERAELVDQMMAAAMSRSRRLLVQQALRAFDRAQDADAIGSALLTWSSTARAMRLKEDMEAKASARDATLQNTLQAQQAEMVQSVQLQMQQAVRAFDRAQDADAIGSALLTWSSTARAMRLKEDMEAKASARDATLQNTLQAQQAEMVQSVQLQMQQAVRAFDRAQDADAIGSALLTWSSAARAMRHKEEVEAVPHRDARRTTGLGPLSVPVAVQTDQLLRDPAVTSPKPMQANASAQTEGDAQADGIMPPRPARVASGVHTEGGGQADGIKTRRQVRVTATSVQTEGDGRAEWVLTQPQAPPRRTLPQQVAIPHLVQAAPTRAAENDAVLLAVTARPPNHGMTRAQREQPYDTSANGVPDLTSVASPPAHDPRAHAPAQRENQTRQRPRAGTRPTLLDAGRRSSRSSSASTAATTTAGPEVDPEGRTAAHGPPAQAPEAAASSSRVSDSDNGIAHSSGETRDSALSLNTRLSRRGTVGMRGASLPASAPAAGETMTVTAVEHDEGAGAPEGKDRRASMLPMVTPRPPDRGSSAPSSPATGVEGEAQVEPVEGTPEAVRSGARLVPGAIASSSGAIWLLFAWERRRQRALLRAAREATRRRQARAMAQWRREWRRGARPSGLGMPVVASWFLPVASRVRRWARVARDHGRAAEVLDGALRLWASHSRGRAWKSWLVSSHDSGLASVSSRVASLQWHRRVLGSAMHRWRPYASTRALLGAALDHARHAMPRNGLRRWQRHAALPPEEARQTAQAAAGVESLARALARDLAEFTQAAAATLAVRQDARTRREAAVQALPAVPPPQLVAGDRLYAAAPRGLGLGAPSSRPAPARAGAEAHGTDRLSLARREGMMPVLATRVLKRAQGRNDRIWARLALRAWAQHVREVGAGRGPSADGAETHSRESRLATSRGAEPGVTALTQQDMGLDLDTVAGMRLGKLVDQSTTVRELQAHVRAQQAQLAALRQWCRMHRDSMLQHQLLTHLPHLLGQSQARDIESFIRTASGSQNKY